MLLTCMTSCSVVDSAWTRLGLRCLVVALELQLLLSKRDGPQGFYCCLNKAAYVLLREPRARRWSRTTSGPRNNFGWTASPSSKTIIYIVVKRSKINKLNVYLLFKLNYDVCCTYESYLYIFHIIKLNRRNFLAITYYCVIFISVLL
jgi:hypothetical protein